MREDFFRLCCDKGFKWKASLVLPLTYLREIGLSWFQPKKNHSFLVGMASLYIKYRYGSFYKVSHIWIEISQVKNDLQALTAIWRCWFNALNGPRSNKWSNTCYDARFLYILAISDCLLFLFFVLGHSLVQAQTRLSTTYNLCSFRQEEVPGNVELKGLNR